MCNCSWLEVQFWSSFTLFRLCFVSSDSYERFISACDLDSRKSLFRQVSACFILVGVQETAYGPVEIVLTDDLHAMYLSMNPQCVLPFFEGSKFVSLISSGCDLLGSSICTTEDFIT